ncbi:MAG TPA: hypothetical protein VGG08_08675 [Solirubrobacteraceae bacterium]|jgi:uncharacterized protein YjiS (DUF1127 family)
MSAQAPAGHPPLARYQALLDHAELELELAGRGELEALESLGERWQGLIEGLPERPPAEASSLLQNALLVHERTRIELLRLNDALLADLSVARRARRTADGYAGRLSPRPRLDQSA